MNIDELNSRGIVLLGCGKMGSALLSGWLKRKIEPKSIDVVEPFPSDWLKSQPVRLNRSQLNPTPAVCLLAVKPQAAKDAFENVLAFGGGRTVVVSIIAGLPIAYLESIFGPETPIVRTMPNTPAAIGQGITALAGNQISGSADVDLAEGLMSAVGETVRLENEELMNAVTALSGSGPAYVFHLIETMAKVGEELGLEAGISLKLAVATVAGAGQLATTSNRSPADLRVDVTSPGGTTEAALMHLMNPESGLRRLMSDCMRAAEMRGKELGKLHD